MIDHEQRNDICETGLISVRHAPCPAQLHISSSLGLVDMRHYGFSGQAMARYIAI